MSKVPLNTNQLTSNEIPVAKESNPFPFILSQSANDFIRGADLMKQNNELNKLKKSNSNGNTKESNPFPFLMEKKPEDFARGATLMKQKAHSGIVNQLKSLNSLK